MYPAEPQLDEDQSKWSQARHNQTAASDQAMEGGDGQDVSAVSGNVPDSVKQQMLGTYHRYAARDHGFAATIGQSVTFLDVNVKQSDLSRGQRMEVTTIAAVQVTQRMLNGEGFLHGGCTALLIDNCCATPLVVLGILRGANGVGVTQSLNLTYHAPATLGALLRIISTSIHLGGRVMNSRCEVIDSESGRLVASGYMNTMHPKRAKL